ncbi:MAG: tRNA dimethylallyltransferase, partial [Lachnospiraceae bacterium]|nr:tRNA dimethylallyltransferase [Lachnospiraceae bacterium]
MNKLVIIAGTNASGKSGLGIELALKYGAEIVSADSRQVFKGLDLGSGKVTAQEMRGVPHHLLDVAEPNDFFSLSHYQKLAYAAIDDVFARGGRPFLVGGTGLYVNAVVDGYNLNDAEPDPAI